MGMPRHLFVYFRSFQTIYRIKTVDFSSGIRTEIVREEVKYADHLTTTMAQSIKNLCLTNYFWRMKIVKIFHKKLQFLQVPRPNQVFCKKCIWCIYRNGIAGMFVAAQTTKYELVNLETWGLFHKTFFLRNLQQNGHKLWNFWNYEQIYHQNLAVTIIT